MHILDIDCSQLSPFAEVVALALFNRFPTWKAHARMETDVNGIADIIVDVPSPTGNPKRKLVIHTRSDLESLSLFPSYQYDIEFTYSAKRLTHKKDAFENFIAQFLTRLEDFIEERAVLAVVRHQVLFLHAGRTLTLVPLDQIKNSRPRGLAVVRSWRGTYDEGSDTNI